MSFWDGARWVPLSPPTGTSPPATKRRLRDWVATLLMITGLGLLVLPGDPSVAESPSLTPDPATVTLGERLTISGNGFAARQSVQLTWDGSSTGMPRVRASRDGTFVTRVWVRDAAPGTHTLAALAADAGPGRRSATTSEAATTPSAQATVMVVLAVLADTVESGTGPSSEPTVAAGQPTPGAPTTTPTAIATQTPSADPTAAGPTPAPTPVPPPATPTPPPATPTPPPATPTPGAARQLTFAAEFTGDLGAFRYDGQWGCGFGSQSDFMGDLRQVSVAGGVATITAERKQTPCGRGWASAIMSTRGRFAQQYGYFEARIRYDAGNGLWPAFWMNPADGGWPPEIDVLEAYPNTSAWPGLTRVYSTLHYGASNRTHEVITDAGVSMAGGWHRYGMEWQPGSMVFYIDGARVGQITQDVPAEPFYLILNLAVGNWSAQADGSTPDGAQMQIDWVRVYR